MIPTATSDADADADAGVDEKNRTNEGVQLAVFNLDYTCAHTPKSTMTKSDPTDDKTIGQHIGHMFELMANRKEEQVYSAPKMTMEGFRELDGRCGQPVRMSYDAVGPTPPSSNTVCLTWHDQASDKPSAKEKGPLFAITKALKQVTKTSTKDEIDDCNLYENKPSELIEKLQKKRESPASATDK